MSGRDKLWYTDSRQARPFCPPSTRAETVLLFGGTFDPPHVGHLAMATLAREQASVDEVWFLPAPSPPHKEGITDASFLWRSRMVSALIANDPQLRLMQLEAVLPRPSFTVDTVRACQAWYPDIKFSFLMGTDSLAQLPSWHDVKELIHIISFLVAARSGYPFQETRARVQAELPSTVATCIEMPLLDISSTWLRERLHRGIDVCGLMPPEVMDEWYRGP